MRQKSILNGRKRTSAFMTPKQYWHLNTLQWFVSLWFYKKNIEYSVVKCTEQFLRNSNESTITNGMAFMCQESFWSEKNRKLIETVFFSAKNIIFNQRTFYINEPLFCLMQNYWIFVTFLLNFPKKIIFCYVCIQFAIGIKQF